MLTAAGMCDNYTRPMSSARVLDEEILERFEAALRCVGAAIVDAWAPGLRDDEIDALVQPLGIALPEEARVWWRWHDGLRPGRGPQSWDLLPGRSLLSLEDALDLFVPEREHMADDGFPDMLLTPVTRHPIILFGCDGAPDAPVPVYVMDDWSDEAPRLALPSIGELVLTWTSYIDTGIVTTGPDGDWLYDDKALSQEVQELGVY
ncbi:MAG: hypothetical protein QOJ89_3113 [bacterium]